MADGAAPADVHLRRVIPGTCVRPRGATNVLRRIFGNRTAERRDLGYTWDALRQYENGTRGPSSH